MLATQKALANGGEPMQSLVTHVLVRISIQLSSTYAFNFRVVQFLRIKGSVAFHMEKRTLEYDLRPSDSVHKSLQCNFLLVLVRDLNFVIGPVADLGLFQRRAK